VCVCGSVVVVLSCVTPCGVFVGRALHLSRYTGAGRRIAIHSASAMESHGVLGGGGVDVSVVWCCCGVVVVLVGLG